MDEVSIYRAFGRAVAERRKRQGSTQADLARQVGLSRGSVANIELGKQKVFLHQVLAIAHALKLQSAHELVPGTVFGPVESPGTARVTGTKDLTERQRREIDAIYSMIAPPLPKRGT